MCRLSVAIGFILLLFFQKTLSTDNYLFPAAQVLAFLTEVEWKSNETVTELEAVGSKVWSECLARGEGLVRGFSDQLIAFLRATSEDSAKDQLEAIVEKVLEKENMTLPGTEELLRKILKNLKDSRTDLYKELKKVHPLIYN